MIGFQIARLLTRYLTITRSRASVAVLYNPSTREVEAYALDTRAEPFDVGTAAVNVQRFHPGALRDRVILTSQAPLVIELGMTVLTQVAAVVHTDGVSANRYLPGNAVVRSGSYAPAGGALPAEIARWAAECEGHLGRGDARAFATEFANVPAVDVWPQRIQELIIGREVAYDAWTPDEPPAQVGGVGSGRAVEVDAFWMQVAKRLAGAVHAEANLMAGTRYGHNIACVLVDTNQRILAWGVNTISNHPTRHAETRCIWMYQRLNPGQKVPALATLYTTLQSCFMCAATIKHACDDSDVRVVYGDADRVGGRSVLGHGGGAREVALKSVLEDGGRRDLLVGQMMMARARLDRIRQAFRGRLDLAPGQRDGAARDEGAVAQFRRVVGTDRLGLERQRRDINNEPLRPGRQAVLNRYKDQLRGRGVTGPELGRKLGIMGGGLREGQTVSRRQLLEEALETLDQTAQDARNLPYTGGAPMLLRNPEAVKLLYGAAPAISRTQPVSDDEAMRDLTTEIHGLDFLLQVKRVYPGYNRT